MALAAVIAIGITGGTASGATSRVTHVDVRLQDFAIQVSKPSGPAGRFVFRVHNAGPSTHEINIDRTDDKVRHLPLKGDGLTVQEDAASLRRIDSIEEVDLGATDDLTVTLAPGHYVFYCNLEGHYLGGMHAGFDVRG